MGVRGFLSRPAAAAPVPTFVVVGSGGRSSPRTCASTKGWLSPTAHAPLFPGLLRLDAQRDRVPEIVRLHRALLLGRSSSPPILPDVEPSPWRGVGPYGQGGKGMTGGVPYGRPLAGRGPDRDGLELDAEMIDG